jgi:hypothetical protein
MPDSDAPNHEDDGSELGKLVRRNIEQLRAMRAGKLGEADRRRVERLLAEAEAALSEIETPEEG